MKCALLALAGCNSWFGIDPTTERIPDAIDAALPTTTVKVVYRSGLTNQDKGTFGDFAITGATIRANGAQVAYEDTNAMVPLSLLAAPWQLEVTAPDQTPVELQWMPSNPQVCVPRWGRLDRPALTGDDNHIFMAVTPKNPAIAFDFRSVLTSGVWAQRELSSKMDALDLRWDPTIVTPLDGPLSPIGEVASDGDWMAVVDYKKVAGDPVGRESVEFARTDAKLNASVPVNLDKTDTIDSGTVQLSSSFALGLFLKAELQGTSSSYAASVGLTASPEMANQPLAGGPAKMWTLANYSVETAAGKTDFNAVHTDFLLPRVIQLRRVSTTVYNGVDLDSAVERFDLGTSTAYPTGTSTMVDVAIAKATTVNDMVTSGVASVTETGSSSDTLVSWTPSDGRVDLAVVTMYEVTSVLVPVKQYVTTGTSVFVAKDLMKVGHDYVFEITLRTGFPNAALGDLCTVAYPMADTQLFTAVVNVR